jgi:hypothetical protein
LHYPSDARPAADGNIIVADFVKPVGDTQLLHEVRSTLAAE